MARAGSPGRKREAGNFLAGIGVGVLIGLAVSLAIAFYLNRTPIPFMSAKPKQPEKNGATKAPPIAGLPQTTPPGTPEKPKFDFYRILPGSEEPVTEKEIRDRMRAKGGSGQQEAASRETATGNYDLAVGAGESAGAAASDRTFRHQGSLRFELVLREGGLPGLLASGHEC